MNEQKRINHIDGLRGIAILLVLGFHAYAAWGGHQGYLKFAYETKDIFIFKYGYIGVQLFFMISGYVIFMSLDRSSSIMTFLKKRWLRLFPAMAIATIVLYGSSSFFYERPMGSPSLIDIIPGILFIHPRIISDIFGIKTLGLEGVFWSLYIEVVFYILSAFFYYTFGRKWLLKSIFTIYLSSKILFIFIGNTTLPQYLINYIDILGFSQYGYFIIGCYLYELSNDRAGKVDFIMAVLSFFLITYSNRYDTGLVIFSTIMISIFAFSFYIELIRKILSLPALIFIGSVSYPLYLIHENIMVSGSIKLSKAGVHPEWVTPLISLALITLLSYIIVKLEIPIRKSLSLFIK
ncbi:acyltransferase family protein [Morganella morganii]|uniref:acyltransferase family protein n=1 Tax=Morganella morganii TaxID=582 RepID=UPI00068983D2|nr:acyltransferase [Morganella morganii]